MYNIELTPNSFWQSIRREHRGRAAGGETGAAAGSGGSGRAFRIPGDQGEALRAGSGGKLLEELPTPRRWFEAGELELELQDVAGTTEPPRAGERPFQLFPNVAVASGGLAHARPGDRGRDRRRISGEHASDPHSLVSISPCALAVTESKFDARQEGPRPCLPGRVFLRYEAFQRVGG